MNLLVILLVLGARQAGLLAEPVAVIATLMRRWRDGWMQRGLREGWGESLVLGFVVVPPALLVLAAVTPLAGVWHALLGAAVSLPVLLLVLLDRQQPETVRRETDAWLARRWQPDTIAGQPDLVTLAVTVDNEFSRARRQLMEEQLRELFAPLFWFLLLGPVATTAYYFLQLSAQGDEQPVAVVARKVLHYVEWPVARVLALSFALAGDFVATWQQVRNHALDAAIAAVVLLDESAAVAQPVDLSVDTEADPGAVLVVALGAVSALLHRSLIIWVVLLALHTLWP